MNGWSYVSALLLASTTCAQGLTPLEELGQRIFFDDKLSTPPGQSCATCHAPETGFTGVSSEVNAEGGVYPGAVFVRFGNRKPPTAAYAGDSPVLHYDAGESVWIGGMFWDGRATGEVLGDPLAEQALGPFLNPLEMNTPNPREVVRRIARSDYAELFEQVWGPGSLDWRHGVDTAYEQVGRSIAAFERSSEVNPFSSKYDAYLAGQAQLTPQEQLGLQLFDDPLKGNCAACHPSALGPNGELPLFTDFTFDNLGFPKNPENPFYGMPPSWNPAGDAFVDLGLGGFLKGRGEPSSVYEPEFGKHKVPTLRNVDRRPAPGFVKSFGHNGYFLTLEETVHFYNTRDVEPWPVPEVPANVNTSELGNLGLTTAEEEAIVAFLKTLTDGYTP